MTRGDDWQRIGWVLHVKDGAIFGAAVMMLIVEPMPPLRKSVEQYFAERARKTSAG